MPDKIIVCVCGSGSGAHALAAIVSTHAWAEARVLTLNKEKATRWEKLLKAGDFILKMNKPDGSIMKIKAKPALVTSEASQAIPGAHVIIICMPAFAHAQYFDAILPYIEANMAIIGLPGQPGFELMCLDMLKDKAGKCAIVDVDSLPWVCRLQEFGRMVHVHGTKASLLCSARTSEGQLSLDPVHTLQAIVGQRPVIRVVSHGLHTWLATKSVIHPPLMYATWRDWDGQPLEEKPLFYQGVDEGGAEVLSAVSREVVMVARTIGARWPQLLPEGPECVVHLRDWYPQGFGSLVQDSSSLLTCLRTNAAYDGLTHPMKPAEDGRWVPDFSHRYLWEDVPYGLVVIKGLAQLADIPVPETDRVLSWCQLKMGQEFLVGSKLKGKDVAGTRAPQAYGLSSMESLMALL